MASTRFARSRAVASEAAILAGLCPKSSITSTPRAVPSDWNRRATPLNRDNGSTISSSRTPNAWQAAIAPSAFSTLCRPGTGSVKCTPFTWKRVESDHERALREIRRDALLPAHEPLAGAPLGDAEHVRDLRLALVVLGQVQAQRQRGLV